MARAKEFDRERALERAMQVFWARGYAATSLEELLEAMGIGRQSMYDTFGSKRELFGAALQRYVERDDRCLAMAPSPRRAIREMFEGIVDESAATQRKGCFGINSTVELAPHDAAIAKLIADRQRRLEDELCAALERAKQLGELGRSKDTRGLARFLVGALQGLRVAATADPCSPALRDIARISLEALD
jgi:TetR/AcrR family transcriptional repressor of nem operon